MAVEKYTQALQLYTGDGSWDAGAVDGFPWLFIGSLSAAENHEQLTRRGVRRVLTVARNLPVETFPSECSILKHLRINIDDHPSANFLEIASQCQAFITEAANDYNDQKSNDKDNSTNAAAPTMLVHCASGVSRSVTAVMIWLMTTQKYKLNDALNSIRVNRPFASPNAGFMYQLKLLEKHEICIDTALERLRSEDVADQLERASKRRQLANELHADVDELEIQIQTLLSSSSAGEAARTASASRDPSNAAPTLMQHALQLSDRLDHYTTPGGGSDADGLAEDRVARIVFKSARSKLERLIATLTNHPKNVMNVA